MKKAKVIILVVCILALIVLLVAYLQTPSEETVYSAICIKCLQHAYIYEEVKWGKTIQKGSRFYESHGGVLSSDIFAAKTPFLDARIYEELHGFQCKHIFGKLSYGRSEKHLFQSIASDGPVYSPYVDRVNVIGAIYKLYSKTKNRELALLSYKIVDELYPVENDKLYLNRQDSKRISNEIIDKFKSVNTDQEWRDLINYFDGKYSRGKKDKDPIFDGVRAPSPAREQFLLHIQAGAERGQATFFNRNDKDGRLSV